MCVITRPTYEYEYVCVLLYNASRLVRLPTPYTPPLALARITRLIYGTNVVSTRWIRVLPSGTSTTLELLFEILHATEAPNQRVVNYMRRLHHPFMQNPSPPQPPHLLKHVVAETMHLGDGL